MVSSEESEAPEALQPKYIRIRTKFDNVLNDLRDNPEVSDKIQSLVQSKKKNESWSEFYERFTHEPDNPLASAQLELETFLNTKKPYILLTNGAYTIGNKNGLRIFEVPDEILGDGIPSEDDKAIGWLYRPDSDQPEPLYKRQLPAHRIRRDHLDPKTGLHSYSLATKKGKIPIILEFTLERCALCNAIFPRYFKADEITKFQPISDITKTFCYPCRKKYISRNGKKTLHPKIRAWYRDAQKKQVADFIDDTYQVTGTDDVSEKISIIQESYLNRKLSESDKRNIIAQLQKPRRRCSWCGASFPDDTRANKKTCSMKCRKQLSLHKGKGNYSDTV